MGVRIPAPSEGREGGAVECTQASAGRGVALKECMRQRAIGGVPSLAAECVRCSRGRLVDSSCSFGRNVHCDEDGQMSPVTEKKRVVVWIEGGCLECVSLFWLQPQYFWSRWK
jgi:hypothetical protein